MEHQSVDSTAKQSDSKQPTSTEKTMPNEHSTLILPKIHQPLLAGADETPPTVQAQYATQLSYLPKSKKTRMIQQLQQNYGNRQTLSIMRQIQREDEPVSAHTWTPPFDLASATTKDEASNRLAQIELKLLKLSQNYDLEAGSSEITADMKTVRNLRSEFTGDTEPIDTDAFTRLRLGTALIHTRYKAKIDGMKSRISTGLNSVSSASAPDLSSARDAISEKLRLAFRENADETYITNLKTVLGTIKDYVDKANKYSEWAKNAASKASLAKADKFLGEFGKGSKHIADGLGKANQVLTVAQTIQTMATEQGFSPGMDAIGKFQSAINAIDVAVSFAKAVPLFSELWSGYYKPLTEACLKGARIIARAEEDMARDLEFIEWASAAPRNGYGAPIISDAGEFYKLFPGGQAILNFMWVIMDGGSPPMSQAVISFFVSVAERMSINERHKLKTESTSDWYDPTSWFNEDTIDEQYLILWVSNRKEVIWAMLYGDMKHGSII